MKIYANIEQNDLKNLPDAMLAWCSVFWIVLVLEIVNSAKDLTCLKDYCPGLVTAFFNLTQNSSW